MLKIEYKNINDIIPYENNPRNNDNAVEVVKKSIEKFGFKNPIILDKNNVIVTGHTRLKAAIKLSLLEVPIIYADDLTDEQIKAFRLIDNKTAEIADWDFEKLEEEINMLEIDMSDFGFYDFDELDISNDDFLLDDEIKEKKAKTVKCPYCDKEFEL